MKKINLILCFNLLFTIYALAQTATTFYVGGDLDKYYPVSFNDPGFYSNKETAIEIGRSDVHTNATWRGSLISKFNYHTTNYGHGSHFIDAEIRGTAYFIAGWVDGTIGNASNRIIIWLRGGGNTYYLSSEFNITPIVYDGIQNGLPFQEENGPTHSYKTQFEEYVNNYASIKNLNAYFIAGGNNYFNGNVGIGTLDPKGYRLAVNGKIRAQEIKVEASPWPDYVFAKDYKLPSLQETESHIKEKGHLPGIPSAKEVDANGINLGEINAKLLQKIEELTLHLIEKEKSISTLIKRIDLLEQKVGITGH